jgi:hypothetical protein
MKNLILDFTKAFDVIEPLLLLFWEERFVQPSGIVVILDMEVEDLVPCSPPCTSFG